MIDVFDIRGRIVATLVDGYQNQGHYLVEWNAAQEASGVYIVRMRTESGYGSEKKVLLLK